MSICYKLLNNIDGSSLATFNGKTSFDGIDNITVNEGAFESISGSSGRFGTLYTSMLVADSALTDILTANTLSFKNTINVDNLPILTQNYVWLGDVNNRPTPIAISDIVPLLTLSQGMLWIGNDNNNPIETQTINLNNLPALNVVNIGDYPTPLPQIYGGTSSGIPEVSNSLAEAIADIFAISAKLLAGNFIMGDATAQATWPEAQFLVNLADGMLKKTGKLVQHAVSGVDYVDVVNPIENILPVWADAGAGTPKMLINTGITIDDENRIFGIDTVNTKFVIASDQITSNTSVFGLNNVGSRQIQIYDQWNGAGRLTKSVNLIGPPQLVSDVNLVMPTTNGTNGQVIMDVGSDANNNRILEFQNVLPDGLNNNLLAQGVDANNNPIFINAPLTKGYIWQGDEGNNPVEVQLQLAPNNSTYILQTPDDSLVNAQALSGLATGILKNTTNTGVLSVAIADTDYTTPLDVDTRIEEALIPYVTTVALNAELLLYKTVAAYIVDLAPFSAAPTTGGGISAAIGVVATVAAAAQSAANSANSRIDNLTVTLSGDVNGTGNLDSPVTIVFAPNPVFTGNESLTLPMGSVDQRPTIPLQGMIRYNTEL